MKLLSLARRAAGKARAVWLDIFGDVRKKVESGAEKTGSGTDEQEK